MVSDTTSGVYIKHSAKNKNYDMEDKTMKKKTVYLFVLIAAALLGCATVAAQSGLPASVSAAARNASDDVLVGIGNAKESSANLSRETAINLAKAEIADVMVESVMNAIMDYTAVSEVDTSVSLAFFQSIVVTIHSSGFSGARIVDETSDSDGNYWAVLYLHRTDVFNEINRAVAIAKQKYPEMSLFSM